MAAEYDLRAKPNPDGDGEEQLLYPRLVVKGTIDSEHLIKDIHGASSLTPGDLVAALQSLSDHIASYLSDGYSVELPGIGFFTATITGRPVKSKKEIRAASIRFNGVNFQPSASFKRKIKGELRRAPRGFRKSSALSEEDLKERVKNYLSNHAFLSRTEYSRISGRLRTLALRDLNGWVKEGYLKTEGIRTHKVYLMNEEDS